MAKLLGKKKVSLSPKMTSCCTAVQRRTAASNAKRIHVYRILYRSGSQVINGFMVIPRRGRRCPCIIWNRGGSNKFGIICEHEPFINWMADFGKAGYIVIASQYAGSVGSEGTDEYGGAEVKDVISLYSILRNIPTADSSRVGMFGASRGGMMTFMALSRVPWLRAVVVKAPLTNLLRQVRRRPKMKRMFKQMFGGGNRELKRRSVIHWVNRLPLCTPLLIMHGTADWRVSVLDTLDLSRKLYKYRVPFRLNIYEGDDHELTEHNDEALESTISWFDRFVKERDRLPNLRLHGD